MPDAPPSAPTAISSALATQPRFWTFHAPRIRSARAQLVAKAGTALALFAPEALEASAAALHRRVARLAQVALDFEFSVWRGQEQMTRLFFAAPGSDTGSEEETTDTLAPRFVAHLLADHGVAFARKYPVLEQLLAHVADCWIDANVEIATRLAADRDEIERVFALRFARVTSLECFLSDPHHDSRFVTILTFESGQRLVYKPRSLAVEAAFNALVAWLDRHDPVLPLRTPAVLSRADYGWMEHIAAEPCRTAAEAREYFQRAGRLLGLLHVLGASDLHSENLIAAGAHPVPIDLEVVLRPSLASATPGARAWQQIAWEFDESVLSTGLLPAWLPVPGGGAVNLGGLGGERGGLAPAQRNNRPMLDGRELVLEDFCAEILAGFSALYALLLEQRDSLLASNGPLEQFRTTTVRYVHRPTSIYVRAIQASLGLAELESPAARRNAFHRLELAARKAAPADAAPLAQLAAAEIAAMLRLDVPHFHVPADGCEMPLTDGAIVRGYFQESGFARCLRRLRALSSADRELQSALIRGTLRTNRLRQHAPPPAPRPATRAASPAPASPAALLAAAQAIVHELRDSAVRLPDAVTWLGPQAMPQSDRFNFAPLGHGLYDGALGVAFFLAAWSHVADDRAAAALARQTLQPLLHALETHALKPRLQRAGGGLAAGWGGAIYGLIRCARWLDDDTLRQAARRLLAESASETSPTSPRATDVMFGDAGAIFGLLALHAETREPDALAAAVRHGESLLGARQPTPDGSLAWRGDEDFTTGFSHGAAGCAAALARLAHRSGDARFGHAALEALAFEARVLAEPAAQRDWDSWCHGRPGLLLAEIDAQPLRTAFPTSDALERLLATCAAAPRSPIDQCCCGSAGRIDILHTAAEQLRRPELHREALVAAGNLLAHAATRGTFGCIGDDGGVFSPGLFQGVAGIGYTFLRLAKPGILPSFLHAA